MACRTLAAPVRIRPIRSSTRSPTSPTISTGTTRSMADLQSLRCRTTRSTSATTAYIAGTSCSPLPMTACISSQASRAAMRRTAHPPAPTAPSAALMKEKDKNILLGDTYDNPVTTQFTGFGNIFIMPDQATVAASYNASNPLNSTTDLGVQPRHEGDTGSVETFWPCVGE